MQLTDNRAVADQAQIRRIADDVIRGDAPQVDRVALVEAGDRRTRQAGAVDLQDTALAGEADAAAGDAARLDLQQPSRDRGGNGAAARLDDLVAARADGGAGRRAARRHDLGAAAADRCVARDTVAKDGL